MHITSFDLARVLAFLEPYVLSNLLSGAYGEAGKHTYPYTINKEEAAQLGIKLWRKFGFEPEPRWGVCKVVYVHRTAVIKIPIHEVYAPILDLEIDDLNTRWPDPDDKLHFPYTFSVGDGMCVQERCRLLDAAEYIQRFEEITKLQLHLALWDVHEENMGLALDSNIIKFFDVQRHEHMRQLVDVESTAVRNGKLKALDTMAFKSHIVSTDFSFRPKETV